MRLRGHLADDNDEGLTGSRGVRGREGPAMPARFAMPRRLLPVSKDTHRARRRAARGDVALPPQSPRRARIDAAGAERDVRTLLLGELAAFALEHAHPELALSVLRLQTSSSPPSMHAAAWAHVALALSVHVECALGVTADGAPAHAGGTGLAPNLARLHLLVCEQLGAAQDALARALP